MKSVAFSLALVIAALTVPSASAGAPERERVHADSFGNLVIHSPAGYKRIVVGAGDAASHDRNRAPRIVWHGGERLRLARNRDCEFGAVLVHGRSYMYGLPEGVVPTPADILCR